MSSVSDAFSTTTTLDRVRSAWPALFALVAFSTLSACSGFESAAAETLPATAPSTIGAPPTAPPTTYDLHPSASTSTTAAPQPEPAPAPVTWTAAKAKGRADVFRAPGDAEPFRVLAEQTILGTPTVVLVLGGSEAWVEVLLPGRPNGETGWVRTMDVERYEVRRQAIVDLGARTIQVLDGEDVIFEAAVGIGSPSSPTPAGTFFITDAVRITSPGGPWGPYAFGLSARSDTVTEFNGGDGIIGIHGTNRPNSIGEAQSLGCVRLPNDVMLELAEMLAVGSPVTIRD